MVGVAPIDFDINSSSYDTCGWYLYCNEEIIKESDKLPNKIKISLEKGRIIDKEWNDNNLTSLINDCNNIENDTKDINIINDNIKKCDLNKDLIID